MKLLLDQVAPDDDAARAAGAQERDELGSAASLAAEEPGKQRHDFLQAALALWSALNASAPRCSPCR